MIFDLAAYFFAANATAKILVSVPDQRMFHVETQSTSGLISDSDQTGLLAQWQLTADSKGVWEVNDVIGGANWPYVKGYEYPWGTRSMSIGQSVARSTGQIRGGKIFWGYAKTTLTAWFKSYSNFSDVVSVDSLQYWCRQPGPTCGGVNLTHSIFYLSKGCGIIEEQWVTTTGLGDLVLKGSWQNN